MQQETGAAIKLSFENTGSAGGEEDRVTPCRGKVRGLDEERGEKLIPGNCSNRVQRLESLSEGNHSRGGKGEILQIRGERRRCGS